MKDPISNPIPAEDIVYGDGGGRVTTKSTEERKTERIEEADRAKERERNELATVLQTDAGQAFVMRLLGWCGVYRSTFSSSHAAASFTDGQRHIGLKTLELIQNIDPGLYAHLLVEHVKRQRRLISGETGIAKTH